jgi:Peptidase M50B-like
MVLAGVWHRLAGTAPAPSGWVLGAGASFALLLVVPERIWRLAGSVITIAHEGGHAAVSLLSGRRLEGIRLHADQSGVTFTRGRRDGPGVVLTAAAGYVTPSLLGAGSAWLLATGHVTAMLWLAVALLLALLVVVRNIYGALLVLLTGGAVVAVSWLASPLTQAVFAYACSWFLLLGGLRPVLGLPRRRSRASDADQLARLTRLPAGVWVFLFLVISVGAAALGTLLLVRFHRGA